ncbi:hypothetical protein Cob_v000214 [Colletotrichum orbiculare MAFF 240422]|uniref:Uncharacterized protein n=1 Tax=Colletotrichum orbiculare (strain 104-T / ATCC 96160 / CBS 514.97 / LARS 414 / MAFF 240422) TaxID=1213857 RepID=A0A484GAX8_COLOR|nr:hypothetical protein Cob_v000214 [Colletotrichum orbiculare MAFF 240422]
MPSCTILDGPSGRVSSRLQDLLLRTTIYNQEPLTSIIYLRPRYSRVSLLLLFINTEPAAYFFVACPLDPRSHTESPPYFALPFNPTLAETGRGRDTIESNYTDKFLFTSDTLLWSTISTFGRY